MKTKPRNHHRRRFFTVLVGMGLLISLETGTLSVSVAMPNCTVQALSAFGVPNLTVTSATVEAKAGNTPEYCNVKGTLTTVGEGAPNGAANFQIKLPANWQQRFLYLGSGGSGGTSIRQSIRSTLPVPWAKGMRLRSLKWATQARSSEVGQPRHFGRLSLRAYATRQR